ncbi:MAG: hypothetical protein U9R36_01190, partial [Elusimicrobiota bacterium]|nr:hypothetical protein [Elusimicrobiota bacterium]
MVLLVGILAPTGFASAGPLEKLGKAVLNGIVTAIFVIINAIAVTFLELAQALFKWISSPGFMSVSFTGPDNYIVHTGWVLVRNLANTGILLGLVFVGLATAFNIASYDTKKMLLRLLVAALLINFTPVFCGAIIDGSNILTQSFLKSAPTIQSGWGGIFSQQFTALSNSLLDNIGVTIAKALMILVFNFISAIVFLIFAALFAFRYAVLWLLVILSPLAFFAWALGEIPGAKKIFEQWWQNFLNWSIISIPAAFVIFLTDSLMSHAMNHPVVSNSADVASVSAGFVTPFATYGVPILFLIAGFFATLSTSAQGASFIVSKAKQVGRAAGGRAAKGGKALARKTSTATA